MTPPSPWSSAFSRRRLKAYVLALALALAIPHVAWAAAKQSGAQPILPGGNSKDPVSIDADKLVYFDKEQKAVYSGNVVVIQGDTKLTCSAMTVFLDKPQAPSDASDGDDAPSPGAGIRRLEAAGPVTVISKTQVATGDSGAYDKDENKVLLNGHVTLSDGKNVTKGDKLIYDLKTGQATVENSGRTGRVHGQFVPGSADGDASKSK
jgi:lipopolysaccharide export system protein LptA